MLMTPKCTQHTRRNLHRSQCTDIIRCYEHENLIILTCDAFNVSPYVRTFVYSHNNDDDDNNIPYMKYIIVHSVKIFMHINSNIGNKNRAEKERGLRMNEFMNAHS